ncbi:BTAD domain-containing putative transcriptional regulator [Pseudonocardia aurantiaca]|uniref:BTAD domain-containing putative transcriptional regulator n=1 Tax=Pseudonocardia aurantiaca TaxID=75290 RepID=A0ABW4FM33_9PSEU
MRFGLLGPVAVWTSDRVPVAVPGLKVRALLADLLVHDGRPVSADRLIDDLWGERPPGNPAAALSVKVSQLRRALEDAEPGGRDLVVHTPSGYLLRATSDADTFRSLLAEAEGTADPRTRAELLTDALATWRGAALADFADEPFAAAAITRLAEQRLTAQEDRAEARLELGEHAALAGELGALLAEHPLRERLRAAQMRALYRSGRPSEALACYNELRTLLADELGLEPGAELAALQRAILTQDPALAAPVVAPVAAPPTAWAGSNLPEPLTDLIGRDAAIADVCDRLQSDRLVTLTGPGGVGKTRLAVETARRVAGSFPDGVWFVELAALARPPDQDAVPQLAEMILTALDVRIGAGLPDPAELVGAVERLAEVLRSRRLLLVLDNCEHVVESVAAVGELLLRSAQGLRLLATSQEPLALAGEVVWSVPPLEVPDLGADLPTLTRAGAVRLFVARASAASRGFTLDDETARAVGVLCRRLDGIPLALELAATRVRALGVHGLVDRLDDRFRLLATGHRGAPPRQQTLLAMIDWSWELLTGPERTVLRRLAVHADGCTLEAAEAVCGDAGLSVLDQLVRLVDRSLVVVVDGPGLPRYRLLESVAAYCVDRLRDADETERIRQRHQRFYLDLVERAEPHLYGSDQRRWLRRLDAETANLRATLGAAVRDGDAEGALRLVNALTWYWFLRGRLAEARRSLAAALDTTGPDAAAPALRARALAWHTGIGFLHGDLADRDERRRAALDRYEDAGDPAGRARAQWFLAYAGIDLGDMTVAEELLSRALPVFEELGDRWGTAAALAGRAKLAHVRADLVALERDAERSAEMFGEVGDRWGRLEATGWLGALAEMAGDYDRAEREHRDGLRLAEELGLWTEVAGRLGWLGWLALQRGEHVQAVAHCERALRLAVEQGHRGGQIFALIGLAFVARRDGRLDLAETHLRDVLSRTPRADAEQTPPPHLPMIMTELGFVAEQRGDAVGAVTAHLEALDLMARFSDARDLTIAVDGLAGALALTGHHERAARLLGSADAARTASGQHAAPTERADIERITALVRAALGVDRFAAEHALGAQTTRDEVRSLVVAAVPGAPRAATFGHVARPVDVAG